MRDAEDRLREELGREARRVMDDAQSAMLLLWRRARQWDGRATRQAWLTAFLAGGSGGAVLAERPDVAIGLAALAAFGAVLLAARRARLEAERARAAAAEYAQLRDDARMFRHLSLNRPDAGAERLMAMLRRLTERRDNLRRLCPTPPQAYPLDEPSADAPAAEAGGYQVDRLGNAYRKAQ
ncbi:MAG: hypothetical protein GX591_04620 [Planctomycetes bacterium]|nr:hypothetical protein [Planctomycetota bacterium]